MLVRSGRPTALAAMIAVLELLHGLFFNDQAIGSR